MSIKVKPALFKIESLPWKWVRLSELAEMVKLPVQQLWKNFFNLSKDIDTLTISDGSDYFSVSIKGDVIDSNPPWSPQSYQKWFSSAMFHEGGGIFVPAGWAMAVIDAIEKGAVKTVLWDHCHLTDGDECPQGTLSCSFNGYGFVAAVGIREDGSPIEIA